MNEKPAKESNLRKLFMKKTYFLEKQLF